jgi:hypothetical protein
MYQEAINGWPPPQQIAQQGLRGKNVAGFE